MVTNKLTFAVFALVVLFPIYFDAIFLYTVTEAGWTFGGVLKSMLTLNEAIIDVKEG